MADEQNNEPLISATRPLDLHGFINKKSVF